MEDEVLGQEQLNPITGLTGDSKSNVARDVDGISSPTSNEPYVRKYAVSPQRRVEQAASNPIKASSNEAAVIAEQLEQNVSSMPIGTNEAGAVTTGAVEGVGFTENYEDYIGLNENFFTRDVNELRAEKQSVLEKSGHGVLRVVNKAAVETGKLPGYLAGFSEYAFSGFDSTVLPSAFNNKLIQLYEGAEEFVNSELIPVYEREHFRNGNFFQRITDSEFWATTAADGAGFFLGMAVPGTAIKAVRGGQRFSRLLGQFGRTTAPSIVGNAMKAGGASEGAIAIAKRWAKNNLGGINLGNHIDEALATTISTVGEASMETAETVNSLKNSYAKMLLDEKYGEGWSDLNPMLFEAEKDAALESRPDIMAQIGKRGRNVMLGNLATLALPNLLLNRALFNILDPASSTLRNSDRVLAGLHTPAGKLIRNADDIKLKTPWKEALSEFGKSVAREGLFEEGTQFAISKASEQGLSLDEENTSLGKFVADTAYSYFQGLDESEFWEGTLISGLLAGPMQAYSEYKNAKQYNKSIADYQKTLSSAYDFSKDLADVYERDANNNIIFEKKERIDGSTFTAPRVSKDALKKMYDKYSTQIDAADEIVTHLEEGNTDAAYKAFLNGIFYDHAMNYVAVSGGAELLKEQLREGKNEFTELLGVMGISDKTLQKETDDKDVINKTVSEKLIDFIDALEESYQDVNNYGPDFYGIKEIEESPEFQEFLEYKKIQGKNPRFSQKDLIADFIEMTKYHTIKLSAFEKALQNEKTFVDDRVESLSNLKASSVKSKNRLTGEIAVEQTEDVIAKVNKDLAELAAEEVALMDEISKMTRLNQSPAREELDKAINANIKRTKETKSRLESLTKKLASSKEIAAKQKASYDRLIGLASNQDQINEINEKALAEFYPEGADRTLDLWTQEMQAELEYYNKYKDNLDKELLDLKEGQDNIFNKKRKQAHYESRISKLLKAYAEEKELQKLGERKKEEDRALIKSFRKALITKEYALEADTIAGNNLFLLSPPKNSFTFRDDKGDLYVVTQSKQPDAVTGLYTFLYAKLVVDPSTKKTKLATKTVTITDESGSRNQQVPDVNTFNLDTVKKFKLDKPENIVNRKEFNVYIKISVAKQLNNLRKTLIQSEFESIKEQRTGIQGAVADSKKKIKEVTKTIKKTRDLLKELASESRLYTPAEIESLDKMIKDEIKELVKQREFFKKQEQELAIKLEKLLAQENYLNQATQEVNDLLSDPDNVLIIDLKDLVNEVAASLAASKENLSVTFKQVNSEIRSTLRYLRAKAGQITKQINELKKDSLYVQRARANVFLAVGLTEIVNFKPNDLKAPPLRKDLSTIYENFIIHSINRTIDTMYSKSFDRAPVKDKKFNVLTHSLNIASSIRQDGLITDEAFEEIKEKIRSIKGTPSAQDIKDLFNKYLPKLTPTNAAQMFNRIASNSTKKSQPHVYSSFLLDVPMSYEQLSEDMGTLEFYTQFSNVLEDIYIGVGQGIESFNEIISTRLKREGVPFVEFMKGAEINSLIEKRQAILDEANEFEKELAEEILLDKTTAYLTEVYNKLTAQEDEFYDRAPAIDKNTQINKQQTWGELGDKELNQESYEDSYMFKKVSLFTTTTQGVLMNSEGNPVKGQDGKILNNDPATRRWQDFMDQIDAETFIPNHQVRIVSAKNLEEEFSITPPIKSSGALYNIIVNRETGQPVTHNGEFVYSGIAEVSSLFPEGTQDMRIGFYGYLRGIGALDKKGVIATYKNKSYDLSNGAQADALYNLVREDLKQEYSTWRTSVVNMLNAGGKQLHDIEAVSSGFTYKDKSTISIKNAFKAEYDLFITTVADLEQERYIARPGSTELSTTVILPGHKRSALTATPLTYGKVYVRLKNNSFVPADSVKVSNSKFKTAIEKVIGKSLVLANNQGAAANGSINIPLNDKDGIINLFPEGKKKGLIQEMINWGESFNTSPINKSMPIIIVGKIAGSRKLVFTSLSGVKQEFLISDIVDSTGNILETTAGQAFKQYLSDKFVNVDNQRLKDSEAYSFPTDINLSSRTVVRGGKAYESYKDFVSSEILTVEHAPVLPGEPEFINKYFTISPLNTADNSGISLAPPTPAAKDVEGNILKAIRSQLKDSEVVQFDSVNKEYGLEEAISAINLIRELTNEPALNKPEAVSQQPVLPTNSKDLVANVRAQLKETEKIQFESVYKEFGLEEAISAINLIRELTNGLPITVAPAATTNVTQQPNILSGFTVKVPEPPVDTSISVEELEKENDVEQINKLTEDKCNVKGDSSVDDNIDLSNAEDLNGIL